MGGHSQREPRFLWTGLLILIPVLALGAVGLWQLRQDRAAALAGASKEARAPLGDVLQKAIEVARVTLVQDTAKLELASDGKQLIWPKPIPSVPTPISEPSPDAEALFSILDDETLDPSGKAEALHALFLAIETEGSDPTTAAGLPVKQLALRNALRFGKDGGTKLHVLLDWAGSLAHEAVSVHPTVLTDQFLSEAREISIELATNRPWEDELHQWFYAERSRAFYRQNKAIVDRLISETRRGGEGASAWIDSPAVFRCQVGRTPDGIVVRGHPVDGFSRFAAIHVEQVKLPDHFGARLWLDGRLLCGEADAEVVAMTEDAATQFRAEIVFADRDAFFEPVRQRSLRTALLIALAVLAAGVGWFAAWRAFVRQRELAAMKDNFVSAVSHELKAPIASIGLMAEELGAGSKKRKEYTKLIAGECSRLGSLVENVLDYARIESGGEVFAFEEADIGELVRAAAELMRPPALERGIEIEVDAPPAGKLCATVDARAIGRALVNLLDNAIKYAPEKQPITITASENRITVADRGEPIPVREREQIFDRFFRSGSELTRENKGVGIGLSLVRHIAIAHGGVARVESDKAGNRFIFSFNPALS